MKLGSLTLTNIRNRTKIQLNFTDTTIILGQNTAGKTSILEAIHILSNGKSFRADEDKDVIATEEEFARIEAEILGEDKNILTVIFSLKLSRLSKKYLINGVGRRHAEFIPYITTVLFTPEDLDLLVGSPSLRRNFLNSVLSQSEKGYRVSLLIYEKAIKQRNRMLYLTREGKKHFGIHEFEYWDNLLIQHGNILTQKREEFIEYLNSSQKAIFQFEVIYDKSIISRARLDQYRDAELGSATTLVGPQRDDVFFNFPGRDQSIREFGSRGQQRLTVFQLKVLEMIYLENSIGQAPILLLDDIFSELDDENIHHILELLPNQQTIITTTHREFVPKKVLGKKEVEIIEL